MTEQVQILGLRALQAELRAMGPRWPKELRAASKEAAEIVAAGARAAYLGRPGSAPLAATTVKALGQQRSAAVKIGGGRSRGGQVALGNEFGGGKYGRGNPTARGGHTTQFPPYKKSGYALYPTIAAKKEQVVHAYADALDRLAARAFPG